MTGAITEYIDVAQLVLYAFWIFFAGLIYYLHRENKREGYPLESNVAGRGTIQGFPAVPGPKTFLLADGSSITVPRPGEVGLPPNSVVSGAYPGAPIEPIDASTRIGVGPGAYAQRRDIPDMSYDGQARIVPLRAVTDFAVAKQDADPRGLPVVGSDGVVGGIVRDVWVDRSEVVFRYLEIEPAGSTGVEGRNTVLVPFNFARVGSRQIVVDSVIGSDFANVPPIRQPDLITFLEEERVMAFFGAGTLYATPQRAEPLF